MSRCPFPDKDRLTRAEAQARQQSLNSKPGRTPVFAYRCPAGGHHHVGRRPVRKRKRW